MRKFWIYLISFLLSFGFAFLLVDFLVIPTLDSYPRFQNMMDRFDYTELILGIFVGLAVWLFYIQWRLKKLSTIYLYLFYSVYFFLLFVVLFTKASHYHTMTLELFDFVSSDPKVILDAVLNLVYFIPLGVLYGLKATFKEFIIIALLTILGIESIQYLFYIGTFALSDILLNLIGCGIGYLVCDLLRPRFTQHDYRRRMIRK